MEPDTFKRLAEKIADLKAREKNMSAQMAKITDEWKAVNAELVKATADLNLYVAGAFQDATRIVTENKS